MSHNEITPAPEPEPAAARPPAAHAATESAASEVPPSEGEAQTAEGLGAEKAKPKSRAKPVINSIADLTRLAFESNARLLEVSKETLKRLPVTDEDIATQNELVAGLALKDPTLAGAYKLLQLAARQGVQLKHAEDGALARVLNRVVDLAVLALGHNPVFRVWTDQLVNPRKDPQLTSEHLRDEARRVAPEKLGLTPEQFTTADSDRLIKNAVACYGLLRVLQRVWTLNDYVDATYDSFWRHEVPTAVGPERAVGNLAAARDPAVLGIVGATYLSRIGRLERQIAVQERDAAASWNRETQLRTDLAEATERHEAALARVDELSREVVQLRKGLEAERDNRVVDRSHMADDYETLRTRIIRRLGGEIDLLTDGLHALRNGAPNVAEEFLDRSLLALTREVAQLKDASGGLG